MTQPADDVASLGAVTCVRQFEPVVIDDEVVARSLFRIAHEAVNSALKYRGATYIELVLKPSTEGVLLQIADNGTPGTAAMATSRGYAAPYSIGESRLQVGGSDRKLDSIRHRANAINATLSIVASKSASLDLSGSPQNSEMRIAPSSPAPKSSIAQNTTISVRWASTVSVQRCDAHTFIAAEPAAISTSQ